MIELPEARVIAKDLRKTILHKTIIDVRGNFTDHKFTFYYQDPKKYKTLLVGKTITNIIDRNFYIEIEAQDYKILFRDGANIRYYSPNQPEPAKSKFLLEFSDHSVLNITVTMYAFIAVFNKNQPNDNEYYQFELARIGALDKKFTYAYFKNLITPETQKLSAKAFLATGQRILGLGNGVVQDILWHAKIHPKTKIKDLSAPQVKKLYSSTISTITAMINQNGRDTEKDIYGNFGNYETIMSAKNFRNDCPICNSPIKKENYLGGSIYYCPVCQK